MEDWFVYMLECKDGTYYTGITTNLHRRIGQHTVGKAAKYTRGRTPIRLVYSEVAHGRSQALRREAEIKKLKVRSKKDMIAARGYTSEDVLCDFSE